MESLFLDQSQWIASNDLAAAMRDRYPVSPGHTLIVPRRPVPTVFDCTANEIAAMWRLMEHCKRAIDAEFRPDGYNIGINCGADAGRRSFMHTCI